MQTKKRLLTLALSGVLLAGTCVPTLAATVHYNDGATVGATPSGRPGPRNGRVWLPITPRSP